VGKERLFLTAHVLRRVGWQVRADRLGLQIEQCDILKGNELEAVC